ncbi:MAG: DUF4399 domain-containing protein [Rhodospirillaceae bacterium]|nr:DUF4399 domain-containing protein [Rhodospirillaceae bacterium]
MAFSKLALPLALALSLSGVAVAQDKAAGATAPATAKAYIISPKDGETVSSPVVVKFGLKGMGIAPAGVEFDNTGHHHVLVDRDAVDANSPMMKEYMATDKPDLLHFGKGQTEAEIKLAPGKHTLQLVLGDTDHHPHNPPVYSERITITVK